MNVQKMSKSFKHKLHTIVYNTKLPLKSLAIKIKYSGLLHFAELNIYNMNDPKNPLVVISIDKPTDTARNYFTSGVHFYSDFSKMSPKFLVTIQWLVRNINTQMK